MFRPSLPIFATAALCIGLAIPLAAQDQPTAPKVSVASAQMRDVTESTDFIGRGEAINAIDVVARVSGFIEGVEQVDGAAVKAGDLLFEIEADTYQATLEARKADLARAEANLDLARIELTRKETLLARGSGTESERDIALANEKVSEAEVKSAKSAILQAELELGYTRVYAPFSGQIGRIAVSKGELVSPNTGPLVELIQVDPIYVTFSISERDFVTLLQNLGMTGAQLADNSVKPNVTLVLPNGTILDTPGEIVFVDNRVDATTGSIAIRTKFDNKEELIADGAFVTVQIAAPQPVSSLVVPQAAVQRDQRGNFVLAVNEDGVVSQRYVTLGQQIDTEVVVEDGLREGENVIVEGLQKVRPGVEVDAVLAAQPAE